MQSAPFLILTRTYVQFSPQASKQISHKGLQIDRNLSNLKKQQINTLSKRFETHLVVAY